MYIMASERVIARVKWFNNKSGYGFASTCGDETRDVFVHHSNLKVSKEQYRYLVQGEYIELDLVALPQDDKSGHKWQATNITGVMGGYLMCETRNDMRASRNTDTEAVSEASN